MLTEDDDGETLSKKIETLKICPNSLNDLYKQIFTRLSDTERVQTFQIFQVGFVCLSEADAC
jgi:hypothetical protein